MSRVLDFIASQPWGITQEAMDLILEVAQRETDSVEAIERELGRPLDNTRSVRMRGDVAVIPVTGPMFRYANLFTRISGATSYEDLARDIGAALEDPKVRAIVLDVDSPGGLVNGNQELAELIYRAREEKPMASFVSGLGASAAYWITTATGRVVVGPTSILGSIGTVLSARDTTAEDRARGVRTIEFVSSQSPRKHMDPFDADEGKADEARGEIQRMVDDLAQVFVETVARNMGVTVETVLSDFGQGGVLVGQKAVDAGMAHSVGTLEDVIADMQGQRRGGGALLRPGAAGKHSSPIHSPRSKEIPMAGENSDAGRAEQPVIDRAFIEANHGDLVVAWRTEGATAERERVLGIQALHGPSDVKVACVADPNCSVGDAAVKLNAAQKAADEARAGAHLEARAGAEESLDAPKPSAHVDEDGERAQARRIVALHHQLQGRGKALSA